MTEKTAEQIEKDKEAVDAMKYAQAKMKAVLDRNQVLDTTLHNLISRMESFKDYVPDRLYFYDSKVSCRARFEEHLAEARKVL